jgi:hypothetical protein
MSASYPTKGDPIDERVAAGVGCPKFLELREKWGMTLILAARTCRRVSARAG